MVKASKAIFKNVLGLYIWMKGLSDIKIANYMDLLYDAQCVQ